MTTKQLSERSKRALGLYSKSLEGDRRAQFALAESIAVGDFAKPIEPILQAQIVKVYHEQDIKSSQFTTPKTVTGIDRDETVQVLVIDSDQSNIPGVNRGETWIPGTLPAVGPREKYPQIGLFPAYQKTIRARKIGEAFGIDWEAVVNSRGGEVDLIDNAITSFGVHAANTEEADVAKLLVNSQGFTAAVQAGRAMPGNADFSDAIAFADALATFRQNPLYIDGNEVDYDSYTLLCAPGQKYAYERMLAATAYTRVPARTGTDSATPGIEFTYNFSLPVSITVLEWSWLRKVYPNIGKGYVMIPTGTDTATYPVLTKNTLQGFPDPSFWVKDSNATSYRGGDVDVLANGDFDSDAIETKVRHVHGASALWTNGIIYSTGANA